MKRLALALALAILFLSAHLVSASSIVARFAPADTTLDPNVFVWFLKPYLFGDDLPPSVRITESDLITVLNAHIVNNGGPALTQAEISDIRAMKTYYLSLSSAARALYLDSLEGLCWGLHQGLLALVEANPEAFWDEMFLGMTQESQPQSLARQAITGGTYDQVDARFEAEVQEIVSGDIAVLETGIDAAQAAATLADTKAAEALTQGSRIGRQAQTALSLANTANAGAMQALAQLGLVRTLAQQARNRSDIAMTTAQQARNRSDIAMTTGQKALNRANRALAENVQQQKQINDLGKNIQ